MRLTEPILGPIRSVLPRVGMLDFSPLVAMILLNVLQSILVALIRG
jgi:YggT family protein